MKGKIIKVKIKIDENILKNIENSQTRLFSFLNQIKTIPFYNGGLDPELNYVVGIYFPEWMEIELSELIDVEKNELKNEKKIHVD